MIIPEFKKNNVITKKLKSCSGDMKSVEKFIEKYNYTEKEWKYTLSQSQDIYEWIKYPEKISETIQLNLQEYASQIKKILKINKPLTIIDIGCLGGYLYDFMKKYVSSNEKDFHYTGLDIRQDAIKGAKYLHPNCKNTKFIIGSVFELSKNIPENFYDIVMCSRVIIHLPNFDEAIRNLIYITRLKVFIIAKVTSKNTCALKVMINKDTGEKSKFYYRTFSYKDIERVANKYNVRIEIISPKKKGYDLIILNKEKINE